MVIHMLAIVTEIFNSITSAEWLTYLFPAPYFSDPV